MAFQLCEQYINESLKAQNMTLQMIDKANSLQKTNDFLIIFMIIIGFFTLISIGVWAYRKFWRRQDILGIMMPNGRLSKTILKDGFTPIMKVKHSKNDKFWYYFTKESYKNIIRVGNDNLIIYPYHIPRPMNLKDVNTDIFKDGKKINVQEMDFDKIHKSTAIEKFVVANDFIGIIKMMILAILIIVGISILINGYIAYQESITKTVFAECNYNNATLQMFKDGCKGIINSKV